MNTIVIFHAGILSIAPARVWWRPATALGPLGSGSVIGYSYPSLIVAGGHPASQYIKLSGTSMAAPMAAGAAALLFQREPRLTPAQVKSRLMKSAGKAFPGVLTTYHDTMTIGARSLDIAAALQQSGNTAAGRSHPS